MDARKAQRRISAVSKLLSMILVVLMLLSLLILVPSGSNAEIVTLGLNDIGLPPQENCYDGWTYEDPSISVRIEKGRMFETNYLAAYVKIANASQIRTAFSHTFDVPNDMQGHRIARRVNAVLAINGDFYTNPELVYCSYVCRQGKVYRLNGALVDWKTDRWRDILIIDDHGDFHILKRATREDLSSLPYTAINGFTFGPGLVIDGVKQTGFVNMNNASDKPAPRMCIAQVGPLDYLCIYTEGPEDTGSTGLTLDQFADFVASFEGVQNAYNLDGGVTTWMVFKQGTNSYAKINGTNPKKRPIADILYFVTAWQE